MTVREQLTARLLLLVARMFADDPELRDDIKHVSNKVTLARTADVGLIDRDAA
jgi:hypothetical protein